MEYLMQQRFLSLQIWQIFVFT